MNKILIPINPVLFITGSRSIRQPEILFTAFRQSRLSRLTIKEIIHGGAKFGVDQSADILAAKLNLECRRFSPEFEKNAPRWAIAKALLGRNTAMAEICDVCLALWDGQSKGTKDAFMKVKKMGKPYFVFIQTTDSSVELAETNVETSANSNGERQGSLFK